MNKEEMMKLESKLKEAEEILNSITSIKQILENNMCFVHYNPYGSASYWAPCEKDQNAICAILEVRLRKLQDEYDNL